MTDDVTMASTLTADGVTEPASGLGATDPTPVTKAAAAWKAVDSTTTDSTAADRTATDPTAADSTNTVTNPTAVSPQADSSAKNKSRWGLLRQHDFRQLFLADAGSQFGLQIGMLALPLVAAITLHASPFEMGMVAAGDTVPFVIATLPAGVLVDRVRRRPVMIACDLGRLLTLAVIPVAWLLGVLAIWQVVLVAFAIGMFSAVFDVAYQSLLPSLVTKDEVMEGNSKLTSLSAVSQIGGPAAAGWIIRALTPPYAVALNAVTYLSSAAFLGRIRTPEPRPVRNSDAHMGREIVEGLRYVAKHPVLRAIALEASCMNFFNAITNSLLLYLFARVLGLSAGTIGLILSVASLGGLAGALLASRVGTWIGTARVMWLVPAVVGPLWLTMPLMHRGIVLWLVAAAFTVVIAGSVIFNVTSVTFRQRMAPAHLLGRVNATMRFLILGLMPVGALIGGALGSSIGVRNTLWFACVGCALSWLPAMFSPLRTMRNMPEPAGEPEEQTA